MVKFAEEAVSIVPSQCTDSTDQNDESSEECKEFKQQHDPRHTTVFGFANTEDIKRKVREQQLAPPAYNVHERYHETGIAQQVARHAMFENVTLCVIVANALWIWIDTDYNTGQTLLDAPAIFVIADFMFFTYFSAELGVRFMAFKRKSDCCKDAWFVFDSVLVACYLFDPFIIALMTMGSDGEGFDLPTSLLRLFRLLRLSRLVRMLRSLPELMIMIQGMMKASASVGYTLVLLLICTYIFAIVLTLLSSPYEFRERYFPNVPIAMYSLIIYGTFLDALVDFTDAIREEKAWVCLIIVAIYICLASMTVLNMLIGVLCEVISAVAEEEKESMMIDKVHEKFGAIVEGLDKNCNGMISWREFQKIVTIPEALRALNSVGVDPIGFVDMAEDVFFQDGVQVELGFEQFMGLILDLRGSQQATLKDIMSLNKHFNVKFRDLKTMMKEMENKLDQLLARPAA
jgi:hypothetical protein